jgi:hypothetical protein
MSKRKTPSMVEAALKYLDEGYSVIPLKKDKTPLIKWKKYQEEFAAPEEVKQWFSNPEAQIGIVTGFLSDIVVIDVEADGDPSPYPDTMTAKTGGGGWHFYYKHPGFPIENQTKFVDSVDIRGDGGYVVAPPSVSNKGPYEWLSRLSPPELTLFPVSEIEELYSHYKNQKSTLIPTGERNNAATKKIGEILARSPLGAATPEAWEELNHWNQTELAEPLPLAELAKVYTSISTRQERKVDVEEFVLKPFTLRELYKKDFPETQWVAKKLLPLGCLAAITGESSTYKSFLTLALAEAVVTGNPFLGVFGTTQAKGKVLIVDEENSQQYISNRMKSLGVPPRDEIYFLSQDGVKLDSQKRLESLVSCIETIQPTLVILDSMVRFHNKDENSATEMKIVMDVLRKLVADRRTILFIHHHKKEQQGGSSSNNSIRGSTDIFNALDCHIGVRRQSGEIKVSQQKLRAEPEMDPFKVMVECGDDKKVTFIYQGPDTSREDAISEIEAEVLIMLTEVETLTRPEILEAIKQPTKLIDEALKKLSTPDGPVTRTTGPRRIAIFGRKDFASSNESNNAEN